MDSPVPGIPATVEAGIPATDTTKRGSLPPTPSLNPQILPLAERFALPPHSFQQGGQLLPGIIDMQVRFIPSAAPALLLCLVHTIPKNDYLCSCRESKARGGRRREASPSSFKSARQTVSDGPLYFFVLHLFSDQDLVAPCRLAPVRLAAPLQPVVELVLSGEDRIIE